ncbi:MAG: Mov34/MPN/PAD-1 family protein [Chloroflexota bacterium]|nr:Mov34/MPN/PAD-1 family protein [Chloroflexota bacterium]
MIARAGPPQPCGLIADVVVDGAGLYLAAGTPALAIRVRLAHASIPGLPVVPMGVTLRHGPIDASLWDALVQRALEAMPHEVLLALIAREPANGELFVAAAGAYTLVEPQLDETGTGDWQPQQASGCAVRATPIPDAVVEVHSHHAMPAYFSATDDRDETARRVYGVLGRLDSPSPEVALRLATGCKPHAVEPVKFAQVFAADMGVFRDVNFPVDGADVKRSSSETRPPLTRPRRYGRPSILVGLLLEMAGDLAVIRQGLESRRSSDWESSPLWTPR